jgi:hypothetical protein
MYLSHGCQYISHQMLAIVVYLSKYDESNTFTTRAYSCSLQFIQYIQIVRMFTTSSDIHMHQTYVHTQQHYMRTYTSKQNARIHTYQCDVCTTTANTEMCYTHVSLLLLRVHCLLFQKSNKLRRDLYCRATG